MGIKCERTQRCEIIKNNLANGGSLRINIIYDNTVRSSIILLPLIKRSRYKIEEYKIIPGFEDYGITKTGKVYTLKNNNIRLKKSYYQKNGYENIDLMMNGKRKHFLVHRLVANAFIPNPNNYDEVHHKDEDKTNNNIENLEWCTRKQNLSHYYKKGKPIHNFINVKLIRVKDDKIIKDFKTKSEACKFAKDNFNCSSGYLMKGKISKGYKIIENV